MDPQATIREILALVAALIAEPVESRDEWLEGWFETVERVEALNDWVMRGGFLPAKLQK